LVVDRLSGTTNHWRAPSGGFVKPGLDRAIAIGSVAAVAIVPTVLLVVLKVGVGDPSTAPGAPAAMNAAATSGSGFKRIGQHPKATLTPGSGWSSTATATPSPTPSPTPTGVTSYTVTGVEHVIGRLLSAGTRIDSIQQSTVVLKPAFGLTATGRTTTVQYGQTVRSTSSLAVSGGTVRSCTDKVCMNPAWTSAQHAKAAADADPRRLTSFMRGLMGGRTSAHYQVQAGLNQVTPLLPADLALKITQMANGGTVTVDLWADGRDWPTKITIVGHDPGADITVTDSYSNYG
jgi:hypothetical protein